MEKSQSGSYFAVRPPQEAPSRRLNGRRDAVRQSSPEIPFVWSEIQKEQERITEAPLERAKEQNKTDLVLKVRAATENPKKIAEDITSDNEDLEAEDDDLIEIRSKIETLLDEHRIRATENESNLVELRIVLDNLMTNISEESETGQIEEATKYMGQVQDGQNRLQESINYLVKGAAQLFIQKNKVKVDKLRSDINDIAFLTSQVDEQIRVKNGILEDKLNASAKIDASNAILRRRIESTKNEIRSIAGQDFESIPELARTYNDTMKRVLQEEVDLTKQLWQLQSQLEKEKKEQVQMTLMYQKVKDHPIKVAQLKEEMEAKISKLRQELFDKEKANSLARGQTALQFQTETQKLVMQARKEREEQLFALKTNQIQALLQAEKQARDDKVRLISSANSNLSGNRAFKAKLGQFDKESKQLVEQFEQKVKQIKIEFQQSERKIKKEQEQEIQAEEEKGAKERKGLETEVAMLESSLQAKNEQYQHSSAKLNQLQEQLTQLKEKIARLEVANQQLESSLDGNGNDADEIMIMLQENEKRKLAEKQNVMREMLDAITGLAYFMALTGEKEGDWVNEARECYAEALAICESQKPVHIPIPFNREKITIDQIMNSERPKIKRRKSLGDE